MSTSIIGKDGGGGEQEGEKKNTGLNIWLVGSKVSNMYIACTEGDGRQQQQQQHTCV